MKHTPTVRANCTKFFTLNTSQYRVNLLNKVVSGITLQRPIAQVGQAAPSLSL
jgi:hypothetical protein